MEWQMMLTIPSYLAAVVIFGIDQLNIGKLPDHRFLFYLTETALDEYVVAIAFSAKAYTQHSSRMS
jgi:hypothetical protein